MTTLARPRRRRLAGQPVQGMLVTCLLVLAGCGGGEGGREQATDRDRTPRAATDGEPGPRSTASQPRPRLVKVGSFDAPLHVVAVPGTQLVAVVEKGGLVRVVEGMACRGGECPDEPVTEGEVVVDLEDDVSTGPEQGLLGLAFHPDWPKDDRIFLNYTDRDGDTRIEAWTLRDPKADARRERELMRIPQPFENHNGGHLAFGPDGLLYAGTGDGGSAGDPGDRAQDPDERLGKLLRVDVDVEPGSGQPYAIPEGNLRGGAPEVWALGLRNPWRFSFDRETGDLWIGDVGQNEREEIDALSSDQVTGGAAPNLGWRLREGFAPFDDSGRKPSGALVAPVLDYGRDDGCSVTGGVVYRGRSVPSLRGWYLFADFCEDDLRLLDAAGVAGSRPAEGALEWERVKGAPQVASFGEVQDGEVLVVSLDGGIHQVVEDR